MKYAFIDSQKVAWPVTAMCEALGVSKSGYYDWVAEPITERERRDVALASKVRAIFGDHRGRYGSPRVAEELRADGEVVNEKRVARIMRKTGLVARRSKRFVATTDSAHAEPIAPNLLKRNFATDARNRVWVTDVTAIWTMAGWLYLAAILDLYSRRVVGWATSDTNDTALALDALRAALRERRPAPGLVHHSDRGSPYASAAYRAALSTAGIVASMSRKGDCWDNAVAESFNATLKTEAIDHVPADHDAGTRLVAAYIDGYYNVRRRHSFLGYETPITFEWKRTITEMAA